eukprot:1305895-Amphidinium_carterae.4
MNARAGNAPHSHQEVSVALYMAELPKQNQHDDKWRRFESQYRPLFLDKLECTTTHQKYVVAVLGVMGDNTGDETNNCLCVAFADTHQPQDWLCNLDIRVRYDHAMGGGAHAGFMNRAKHVQLKGLRRICTQYGCRRVLFSGFSLGGAVAQLTAFMALRDPDGFLGNVAVRAVGFGSPLCVLRQLVEHAEARDWSDKFLTIVNDLDPVPRLLNLLDSVDHLLHSGNALGEDLGRLCRPVVELVCALSQSANDVQAALGTFIAAADSAGLSKDWLRGLAARCDLYEPLGTYAFAKRGGREIGIFSSMEVKEELGAASLLRSSLSPLQGLVDYDALMCHSLLSYKDIISTGGFAQRMHASIPLRINHAQQTPANFEPLELQSAEHGMDNGRQMRIVIQGKGLDFVGRSGFTITDTSQSRRIEEPVEVETSDMWFTIIRLTVSGDHRHELQIEVQPDYSQDKQSVTAQYNDCLAREYACAEHPDFDDRFLALIMKAAWLQQKYQQTYGRSEDQNLLPEPPKLLQDLDDEILPREGHILRTESHVLGQVLLIAIGVGVAAIIVSTAGAGVIPSISMLYGSTAALTGGVGTSVAIVSGATLAAYQMYFKTSAAYLKLLRELYVWTGSNRDCGMLFESDQYRAEEALIAKVSLRIITRPVNPKARIQGRDSIPRTVAWECHTSVTGDSEEKLNKLYNGVRIMHGMKQAFAGTAIVCIQGRQGAGKTFLSAQLMMDPSIADETKSGLTVHTVVTVCHKFTPSVWLMDTPGRTSVSKDVREVCSNGAGVLAGVHICMSCHEGASETLDVTSLVDVFKESGARATPVLYCLNKVGSRLTDGMGSYYDIAHLQSVLEGFKRKVRDEVQKAFQEQGFKAWLYDLFKPWFEAKWKQVKFVFCELGPMPLTDANMPPELQQWLHENVFNARRVAEWIREKLDAKEENDALKEAVQEIDFDT